MAREPHSSMIVKLLSVTFFLLLSVAALSWFTISVMGFISGFAVDAPVVEFDKGSMYMLGGGICCLLLSVGGIMQGLLRVKLTSKLEGLFTKGVVGSLILMFGFPHLSHYAVANYTQQRSYVDCSDLTYRWLLYSKFYYTKSGVECGELVSDKEISRGSSSY